MLSLTTRVVQVTMMLQNTLMLVIHIFLGVLLFQTICVAGKITHSGSYHLTGGNTGLYLEVKTESIKNINLYVTCL